MNKKRILASLLAVITVSMTLALGLSGKSCYFGVRSYCYDMTSSPDFEISLEYCRTDDKCNEYCQQKYNTVVRWSTCCMTDGNPPSCINIQACACKMDVVT